MKTRFSFLQKHKWWIVGAALVLALIPVDPTDVIDAGTPIVELAVAVAALIGGRK